jgi:hypothetical protein
MYLRLEIFDAICPGEAFLPPQCSPMAEHATTSEPHEEAKSILEAVSTLVAAGSRRQEQKREST